MYLEFDGWFLPVLLPNGDNRMRFLPSGPTANSFNLSCDRLARNSLIGATAGKVITCKGEKRDRYGRLVAVCYAGDDDLNAMMVRDGWALAYRRYGKDYVSQETQARAAGTGLWQGTFVEPWEWRNQSREASAEARR